MNILLQGAMDEEVDYFAAYFKPVQTKTVGGYKFLLSDYKGNKIIISQTDMGIINATACTAIAIPLFSPDLVINQGCAGAHVKNLKTGDLIIGESSVYINYFKTPAKSEGEGSNSLEWSCGKRRSYRVQSSPRYVSLANEIPFGGRKYTGVLGSGDLFSRETDRINFLHNTFGEICEDMESVAALKVCEAFNTDRLALRIISNNELTNSPFDYDVCRDMQKFVVALVDEILSAESL